MDDLDQHLLARLRDNARAPVSELARALGLSRTTIQSRLARLERTGVIAGYAVRLSDAVEGARIHAFIMLTVEPKQAAAVTVALRRMAGVRRLQSVSGRPDRRDRRRARGRADQLLHRPVDQVRSLSRRAARTCARSPQSATAGRYRLQGKAFPGRLDILVTIYSSRRS
jgi:DNA-binding Lrp family transcriptional regulator